MAFSIDNKPRFIADQNVGKLTKILRLLGFDAIFFTGQQDSEMVNIALKENRIILTRDTHVPERKIIIGGQVKAVLIASDNIDKQIKQVAEEFTLLDIAEPFTLCLECINRFKYSP
jgi:uncharacterized protein with PIN domain